MTFAAAHDPRAWSRAASESWLAGSSLFQGCTTALITAIVLVNEANLRVSKVQDYQIDSQVLTRLVICLVSGLLGAVALPKAWPLVCRIPPLFLGGYIAWVLVTAPLAYAPIQAIAGAGSLACVLLFAAMVVATRSERDIYIPVLAGLTLYIVGSWITFIAFPAYGRDPYDEAAMGGALRLGGLSHPNNTGRLCALGLGLALAAMRQGYLSWLTGAAFAILSGVSLLATGSRTSLMAALVVSALVTWRGLPSWLRGWAVMGVLLAAGLGMVAVGLDLAGTTMNAVLETSARSGDPTEVLSLSGRTELWYDVWARIAETPLVGHGHGCARFVLAGRDWETHHAHNQFLNILLTTGVVGAALVAAAVAWMLFAVWVQPLDLADVVVLAILVVGMSDVSILQSLPDGYTLLFLIALLARVAPSTSDWPATLPSEQAGEGP